MYIKDADLAIQSVRFTSNSSGDGGALKIVRDDYRSDDTVRINNSIFELNASLGSEGGAISSSRANLAISNTSFENSQVIADGDIAKGGSIYSLGGNLNIKDVEFKGSTEFETFPGSQLASFGGAIFIGEDIERATRGGGDRGAQHNIYNGNQQNSTGDQGGAVYIEESTIIFNYYLSGNSAEKGGAIYIGQNISGGSDYEVKIINCTFTDNTAQYIDGGGAIYILCSVICKSAVNNLNLIITTTTYILTNINRTTFFSTITT
jgi:predicted outer membrane repeat protein